MKTFLQPFFIFNTLKGRCQLLEMCTENCFAAKMTFPGTEWLADMTLNLLGIISSPKPKPHR